MDIYNLANSVVITNKIAKPGDSIVVLTGTTDEISNSLRVLEVTE
jgi:hydroxyethylthiazole kinase-like sugar kinase family protein